MENENVQGKDVPFTVHESIVARLERINKRYFALVILLVALLFTSNGIWIWYESQFADEVYTVESTTDGGGTAIANATGEVTYNGESEGNSQTPNP